MTKRSRREWPPPNSRFVAPPPVQIVHRPGDKGTADPFYQFKKLARDNGKPYQSPEPKREQALLALLQGKAALVIMTCLLLFVIAGLLAVLIVKL